jgi:hypothetical protein
MSMYPCRFEAYCGILDLEAWTHVPDETPPVSILGSNIDRLI